MVANSPERKINNLPVNMRIRSKTVCGLLQDPPKGLQILSAKTLKMHLGFSGFILGYFDVVGLGWSAGIYIHSNQFSAPNLPRAKAGDLRTTI